jgi:hypothetical protein
MPTSPQGRAFALGDNSSTAVGPSAYRDRVTSVIKTSVIKTSVIKTSVIKARMNMDRGVQP